MSKKTQAYTITPADRQADLMPITQIISDAFAGGEYHEEIRKKYVGGSHYDFETSRLAWDGDQLIHHWGVWGYPMRVGSARLRTAGIGAVVTLEPYRQQGIMASAAASSFEAMFNHGYDLTVLRGRHYHKFGYRRAWNYVTTRLNPSATPPEPIPTFELKQGFRALGPADMESVNALYNQAYASVSGSCVRPTYPMLDEEDMRVFGWFDDRQQLAGYVRAVPSEDKTTLQCLEAAGDPEQGLAVLHDLFSQGQYQQLHFFTMPRQHPILQIIRRGACTVDDRYFYHTGWQVRLVNLLSCLQKLLPQLQARLAASPLVEWQGSLHLDAGEQSATLFIDRARIQVSSAPTGKHQVQAGWALARLLIGSDEPGEIAQQEGITFSGQAEDLVEILFPNLHPMMSHWDEF